LILEQAEADREGLILDDDGRSGLKRRDGQAANGGRGQDDLAHDDIPLLRSGGWEGAGRCGE